MNKGRWYELWKAKEESTPVNFGRYIGQVRGKDPGAISAAAVLNDAHTKIKNHVDLKKSHTDKEIKDLEAFLNSIFFPKKNDNKDLTRTFIQTLLKGYQKVYDNKINLNSFEGEIRKEGVRKDKSQEIRRRINNRIKNDKNIYNAALKTIKRQIEDVEALLAVVKDTNEAQIEAIKSQCKSHLRDTYNAYDEIVDIYKALTQGVDTSNEAAADVDSEWNKLRSKMLVEQGKIMNLQEIGIMDNKKTRADLIDTLRQFEVFYETLMEMFYVSPNVYGDVFEYSLALLNEKVYNEMSEGKIEDWVYNSIKKDFVKGSNLVSRGGGQHLISVDMQTIFDKEKTAFDKENDRNIDVSVIERNDGFGNIELSTEALSDSIINTGDKKQSKVDVVLTAPDVAGIAANKQFNISAKNWGIIDNNGKHNLGITSLLRGIDRTTSILADKEETLLNYIYALQQPETGEVIPNGDLDGLPQTRRAPGEKVLKNAHRVGKESLVLDIAMGLSQGDNAADTLIIMDRAGKRIVVIDLIKEMKKFLNNKPSDFYLEGYNEGNIESAAKTIRTKIRGGVSYAKRDRNYVSLMKLFLDTQKASVKLNSKYNTFKQ